jgi:hypothetical protein
MYADAGNHIQPGADAQNHIQPGKDKLGETQAH